LEGRERARLFCALRLPDTALDLLSAWQERHLGEGRIVPRAHLHLTLAFLGHRPISELDGISAALRDAASAARPLVEFMIRRIVESRDRGTIEGQTAAVAAALPIVEALEDPVRQREYAHLLAELAGVAETSVLLSLERSMAGRPVDVAKAVRRGSVQERVEREMLKLLVRDAAGTRPLAQRLDADHFRSSTNRKVFESLVSTAGDVSAIVAGTQDERLIGQLTSLAVEPLEGDPTREYAEGVWARLHAFHLKRRSDELRAKLQRLNPVTDEGYDELFQRLVSLDGELRRLREGHPGGLVTS
jgi:DNA primase